MPSEININYLGIAQYDDIGWGGRTTCQLEELKFISFELLVLSTPVQLIHR